MRLIYEILSRPVESLVLPENKNFRSDVIAAYSRLSGLPAIECDECHPMFVQSCDREDEDYLSFCPETRFTGLKPVFNACFFEWKVNNSDRLLSGCVLLWHEWQTKVDAASGYEHPKWSILAYPFAMCRGQQPKFAQVRQLVDVADDGRFLGQETLCDDNQPANSELAFGLTGPALLAVQLMQCRNIVPVDTTTHDREQKWHRRTRVPKITFKTLRVVPMKLVRSGRPLTERDGEPRGLAHHRCRGHEIIYRDEDGHRRFGRDAGTFWMPEHFRGNEKNGRIVKDYVIAGTHE